MCPIQTPPSKSWRELWDEQSAIRPSGRPFAIVGLPRSRTAWLARFLSYHSPACAHEGTASIPVRSFDEVVEFFRDGWRNADTMLALRLPEVVERVPELRTVVIRRPMWAVRASMGRIGLPMPLDFLKKLDDALNVCEKLPGAIRIDYHMLDTEKACREVFEHCYGFRMPKSWWLLMSRTHIEADHKALIAWALKHRATFEAIYGDVI